MLAPISTANANHYAWGTDCDGWYLVRTPGLHIIEERMPPGAAEAPHHHVRARQFFYVLAGELTLIVGGQNHLLHAAEGLEIAPSDLHQALNLSSSDVRFLVISQPPSQGDRIDS